MRDVTPTSDIPPKRLEPCLTPVPPTIDDECWTEKANAKRVVYAANIAEVTRARVESILRHSEASSSGAYLLSAHGYLQYLTGRWRASGLATTSVSIP